MFAGPLLALAGCGNNLPERLPLPFQMPSRNLSGRFAMALDIAGSRFLVLGSWFSTLNSPGSILNFTRFATLDHTTNCVSPALPDEALWGMIKAQLEILSACRVVRPAMQIVPAS